MATAVQNGAPVSKTVDPRGEGLEWGMKRVNRALKRHEERCQRYAQRERVWLATRDQEANTQQPQRIRFAYQRTDVLMSYLTTDKPVGRVVPLRPGIECEKAAKSAQRAVNIWRRRDHRDEKEIELALNACVFGSAPFKSIWDYSSSTRKVRRVKKAVLGLGPPRFVETEEEVIDRDEPSLIPWNPYDAAWDPRATGDDDMRYVVLFSYPSKPELLAMQEKGIYSNIDDLEPASVRQAQEFQRPGRERDLEGCIEIAEVWDKEQNRQVSIANRSVLVCDRPSPYWHGALPFGVCTTQPNLWTLDGTSEVEIIGAIQREMHSFRDNWITDAKLATKLLLIVDSSVDPKSLDQINNSLMIDDGKPVQVLTTDQYVNPPQMWNPGASLVPLGEQIISALKTDMDDMSGVNQYISGQTDTTVDVKTATEVQTLATASQRRINAKKNQLGRGYERASIFDLKNMRQFMAADKPLCVRLDGFVADAAIPGKENSWDFVDPQDVVDAEFELLMTNADESIDKQQERDQWLMLFNTFAASAPAVFPPGVKMPDFAKLAERVFEAFDVEDPSEYMLEPPPPMPPLLPPVAPGVPPAGGGALPGASPSVPAPLPQGGPGQAAPNPLVGP